VLVVGEGVGGPVASCRVDIYTTWHDFNDRLSRLNTRPGTRNKAEQPNKRVLHVCSQGRSSAVYFSCISTAWQQVRIDRFCVSGLEPEGSHAASNLHTS